jgi:hypothetical protein
VGIDRSESTQRLGTRAKQLTDDLVCGKTVTAPGIDQSPSIAIKLIFAPVLNTFHAKFCG